MVVFLCDTYSDSSDFSLSFLELGDLDLLDLSRDLYSKLKKNL